MPQMAPLWWELLFVMFIWLFMMISMIIYFNKMNNPEVMGSKSIETNQKNWKW
nr:ATP synthase subunit 8 [Paralycambes pronotalis]